MSEPFTTVSRWFPRLLLAAATVLLVLVASAPTALADTAAPVVSRCAGDAGHGALTRHVATTDQGSMTYYVYVPDTVGPRPGVDVLLHGSNADVRDAMCQSGLNEVARQRGIVAVYPQEDPANGSNGIWNWGEAAAAGRSGRAPTLIATITRQVVADQQADPRQVFLSGFSAGAGMAVVAAATYPDVFGGISVEVGCMYAGLRCNPTTPYPNSTLDPDVAALTAYRAMGPRAHRIPMIISWGTIDPISAITDQTQLIRQWLGTNDWADDGRLDGSVSQTPSGTGRGSANGRTFTTTDWRDADGCVLVRSYAIDLLFHSYSGGTPLGVTDLGADPTGPNMRDVGWQFLDQQATAAGSGCAR